MKAERVIGCVRCAKPCALVGDTIPTDKLCLWCRFDDAPLAWGLVQRDLALVAATPPTHDKDRAP